MTTEYIHPCIQYTALANLWEPSLSSLVAETWITGGDEQISAIGVIILRIKGNSQF